MKNKLLIFDCDGVLRSFSWAGIYTAYQEICVFAGRDPNELFQNIDEFQAWFNTDWHVNVENIGGIRREEYPEVGRIFHRIHDPHIETFPWVERIFGELSKEHTIVVLSASFSDSVRKSLAASSQYISLFIGAENVNHIKPHPEGIYNAIRAFPTELEEVIMIGDTEMDILAGKSAGVLTGAVDWGMRGIGNYLVDLDPDHVFHSPEDFLSI